MTSAARPAPAPSATAAPIVPLFRPGRQVSVMATDFAPPGGWKWQTMFGPPIEAAVRTVLERLNRAPGEVVARRMKMGDVALLTARDGEPVRPLAFVWEGLSEAEVRHGLDVLARAGWRPQL
jgi:hypothetical protein